MTCMTSQSPRRGSAESDEDQGRGLDASLLRQKGQKGSGVYEQARRRRERKGLPIIPPLPPRMTRLLLVLWIKCLNRKVRRQKRNLVADEDKVRMKFQCCQGQVKFPDLTPVRPLTLTRGHHGTEIQVVSKGVTVSRL
jgi:hypothetical protein